MFLASDSISSWCKRYISFIPTCGKLYSLLIDIAGTSTQCPSSQYEPGADTSLKLISGLKKANVTINRKMLAEIAVTDAEAFAKIAEIAKNA